MVRPAACVACRQNKLRCNASSTFPAPCARCSGRHINCKVDLNYKRVHTRNRVEQLTKEIDRLKSGVQASSSDQEFNSFDTSPQSPTNQDSSCKTEPIVGPSPSKDLPANLISKDILYRFDEVSLSKNDGDQLFQEYFTHYHHQLPVLEPRIRPEDTYEASSLLFWTIIFTATRNTPSHAATHEALCNKLLSLLGTLMMYRHDALYPMEALLILTVWPPPAPRQSDDMRWVWSGTVMHMALHVGCHRVGYEHEYHAFTYSKTPVQAMRHTRIWRSWCFTNALLSCELGLPCLVPFDAQELKPTDKTALPADFLSKLRIVLSISRINDTLGGDSKKDSRNQMRMLQVLETDLNSVVSGFPQSPTQWNSTVEFIFRSVLINLYSTCLQRVLIGSMADPDYGVVQSSAAQAACRIIELFSRSSSPSESTSQNSQTPLQRYLPKFYNRFTAIALLVLLKISSFNHLPLQQVTEVNDSIRLGYMALKSSPWHEAHRAAAVVEVLCKKRLINSSHFGCPVKSRLGASLWLELVATAVAWRRENSEGVIQPSIDPGLSCQYDELSNDAQRPFSWPDTTSNAIIPAESAAPLDTFGNVDTTSFSIGNGPLSVELTPFNMDDWTSCFDVQSDWGLGCDTNLLAGFDVNQPWKVS